MHPPTKDQADIGVEDQTLDASEGADQPNGTDNKDMARQEYKNEADINYMLSRFGITQPRGTPTYGEWDDTIDLQSAISSVIEAKQGYERLPKELRDKFPSMEDFLTAVDNGSLVITDTPPPPAEPPIVPPEVPIA